MKIKSILIRLEEIFKGKVSVKNSWGKNEILELYKSSVNELLMELLEGNE